MLSARQALGVVAGVVALAAVIVVVRRGEGPAAGGSGSAVPSTTAAAPPPTTGTPGAAATTTQPTVAMTSTAAGSASTAAKSALASALASPDRFARKKAIDDAVAAKDLSALPELYAVDLSADGYVAAAAIEGVGKLAALLPVAERKAPIGVLDKWLRAESTRDAKEAIGNATIAVEALGDTKSKDAVQPLLDTLDAARVPLALQTRIVEVLGELGDPRAAPAIQRFLARVEAEALRLGDGGTSLEQELVKEARAAGQAVLAKWKV